MSKIPRLARSANIAETKYQVTTKIKSCIKFINLDRTKIYKCRRCNNIVDLTCEGWPQKQLIDYGRLSDDDARRTHYVCNYCKNAQETFNSLKEKLESEYNTYVEKVLEKVIGKNLETWEYFKDRYKDHTKVCVENHNKIVADFQYQKSIIKKLQERLENLNKELENIKSTAVKSEELEQKISDINEKLCNHQKQVTSIRTSRPNEEITDEREYHDQYIRRNRVVFIGVPSGISDIDFITELCKELELEINESNIQKTFRINARNIPLNKTLPLNIEFRNIRDKKTLLSAQIKEKLNSLEFQI